MRTTRKTTTAPAVTPTLLLTARDKSILSALNKYHVLTTSLIQKLSFPVPEGKKEKTYQSVCRRRLFKLLGNGYIAKIKRKVYPDEGGVEKIFALNRRGAELLAQTEHVEWKAKDNIISLVTLDHTLAVSEVMVALEIHLRNSPYSIKLDIDERELRRRKKSVSGERLRLSKIPDRFVVIRNNENDTVAGFFLEIDLASESIQTVITEKIIAYTNYYMSMFFEQDFGLNAFRVLFIVKGDTHRLNIKKLRSETGELMQVTSLTEFKDQMPFIRPIWQSIGGKGELHTL